MNNPMSELDRLQLVILTAIEMDKSGMIRKMSPSELGKFRNDFPGAEMVLGDYVISKRPVLGRADEWFSKLRKAGKSN